MQCDKTPEKIKNLFDEISTCYDMMNNLISLGTHYLIKYLAIKELEIKPRTFILDLCCGTGDFSKIISKAFPRAKIIGLDFSKEMIKLAKNKNKNCAFMLGDCTQLPFKKEEFDYITVGFGLRNIQNREQALKETYRVLKEEGKFLHLDFGYHNKISKVFNFLVTVFARSFSKNPTSYKYLLNSIDTFPEPEELIKEFDSYGFKLIKKRDFLFGTISCQILQK